jgi:DNA replication protein DnaC
MTQPTPSKFERRAAEPRYKNEDHINNPSHGALAQIVSKMPKELSLDMVTIETDCAIHGKQSWQVFGSAASSTECQKCKWDRDAFDQRMKLARDELLANIDMPKEHLGADFKAWAVMGNQQMIERHTRIISVMRDYAANYSKGSKNILLTGSTGTGKTKLACLIANAIVRSRFSGRMSVVYKRSSQIQQEIKATWAPGSKDTEAAIIERISRATVLILDEVGEGDTSAGQAAAEKDRERLSAIIDRRYQLGLPTIITTNMSSQAFYQHVGDRAADRLQQRMIDIPCSWPSYRMLNKEVVTL